RRGGAEAHGPGRPSAGAGVGEAGPRARAARHRHHVARRHSRTPGSGAARSGPSRRRPDAGRWSRHRALAGERRVRGPGPAAARAGVELALLNTRLAEAELPPLLDRLGPALRLGALPGAAALEAFAADARPVAPTPLDPARIHTLLFTSGTTGRPKAAQLSIGAHHANARASIETLRMDDGSSYLCNLPLFHVGGIATAVRCALAGATLVLHRRFDA